MSTGKAVAQAAGSGSSADHHPKRPVQFFGSFTQSFSTAASHASPALPAVNNHILARHIQRVDALEQKLLEQQLLKQAAGTSAATNTRTVTAVAEHCQDDARLPSNRYCHMSDMLTPDEPPETFDAWVAEMEQQLQQRLACLRHHQQHPGAQ